MKHFLPLILALSALPVHAQSLDGEDRASNWRVVHSERFGLWESMCDEREEPAGLHQRCYIRHVDVFSPAPQFGAIFTFVHYDDKALTVEFGIEPGTLFGPNGFRIERGADMTWRTHSPGCLTGVSCTFTGQDAGELVEAMAEGGAFRLGFRDRHGKTQDLTWPLEGFAEAHADLMRNSGARGLLPSG
ncbi:hypothetical protein [Sagittula sp. S175]|uniref:hypothetical protein n=1 Tax=Sagittula sp. S175 TaxID=3415129 RepID=UPI003C7BEF03